MNFGIAIIVYNPDSEVLNRIAEYNKICDCLIIYDNTEVENEISNQLKNSYSHYYRPCKNGGMSGALNNIFQFAHSRGVDWLLTMDQDSDFYTSQIINMIKIIKSNKNKEIAIFCPNYRKLYLDKKNSVEVPNDFCIPKSEEQFRTFSMTSGSFCNVEYVKQILPLENLFIGYVDYDLCYSLIEKNYKIKMIGNIYFDQRVGDSLPYTKFNKMISAFSQNESRYYYMVRNNLLLQKKYASNNTLNRKLKLNLIRILINLLLVEKSKIRKIRSCIKGYNDSQNGGIQK